jgi:hypothetical protein
MQGRRGAERATTENVCSGGARVVTQRTWELNERLILKSLADDRQTVARVVYCERLADGRFGIGMSFLGVTLDWPKAPPVRDQD